MFTVRKALSTLFIPALLLGCDDGVGPQVATISADEAELLASQFDDDVQSIIQNSLLVFGPSLTFNPGAQAGEVPAYLRGTSGSAPASAVTPVSTSITRTITCPLGGQSVVAGTVTGSVDRATRTLSMTSAATKTDANCAVGRRNGVVITTNGDPNLQLAASWKLVGGRPTGLQTTSQKGAFTFSTSDGRSGKCAIDIAATFDPETRTHTLKGTSCGRTIDVSKVRG